MRGTGAARRRAAPNPRADWLCGQACAGPFIFGANAPLLNVTGQACYEELRLLEVMGNKAGGLEVDKLEGIVQWQYTDGPRGLTVMHDRHAVRDIYLAKAEGTAFQVIKTFEAVNPGEDCQRVKK